jgi:hypothetical protein
MKAQIRLTIIILLANLLTGCIVPLAQDLRSLPTVPPHLTTETPVTKIETTPTLEEFPADVNPLTGLQVQDSSALERRPLVVKI